MAPVLNSLNSSYTVGCGNEDLCDSPQLRRGGLPVTKGTVLERRDFLRESFACRCRSGRGLSGPEPVLD
jgi:hypothetical protein